MEDSSKVSIFPTTQEMWGALKSMNEGTKDLKRSKIFTLTEDMSSLRQKPKESVDSFHGRFAYIHNLLTFLGKEVEEWR